jgi:hypothetical protein
MNTKKFNIAVIYSVYWRNSNCGVTAKTVDWKFIWQVLQTLYVHWKSFNPLIYVLSRDDIPSRWDFPLPINTEISTSGITILRVLSILYRIFSLYIFGTGMQTGRHSRHVSIQVFRDVTPCHWESSSQHFEGLYYSAFIIRVKQCKKTSLKVKAPRSVELLAQWYRRLVSSATQLWKPQISFGAHTAWVFQYCYVEKIKQVGRSRCTCSWTRDMLGRLCMFQIGPCKVNKN